MFKTISLSLFIALFILSCKHKSRPTTAMDTGTTFIRATLDGDFDEAKTLLYNDTLNDQFFQSYMMMYERLPDADKKNYKDADYVINKYTDQNDSVSVINFSNTYMKKPLEIKLVRKNGDWLVDFKYTVSDSSQF